MFNAVVSSAPMLSWSRERAPDILRPKKPDRCCFPVVVPPVAVLGAGPGMASHATASPGLKAQVLPRMK